MFFILNRFVKKERRYNQQDLNSYQKSWKLYRKHANIAELKLSVETFHISSSKQNIYETK